MITKTDSGGFAVGQLGTFILTVQNVGNAPTSGPITVTDRLPAGLTAVSASGTGWDCSASSGQNVICVYESLLTPHAPPLMITIVVSIEPSALYPIVNTATVFTDGDTNSDNDSSTDVVRQVPPGTPTPTPTATPTNSPSPTPTSPPIPVVPTPGSPAGLLLIGGLGLSIAWMLRRAERTTIPPVI
jgi:uncharacterized repeat protein (TIGR01451 family)